MYIKHDLTLFKRQQEFLWDNWFAWHPIVMAGSLHWLCMVQRRLCGDEDDGARFIYREVK